MSTADELAKEALVLSLLAGYPYLAIRITPDLIHAYTEALEPYSLETVRLAIGRYKQGDVEGHDRNFAPNAPQLAALARLITPVVYERDGVIPFRIGEAPPPGYVPLGPTSVDFGHGRVDMSRMSHAEKEEVFRTQGRPAPAITADQPLPRLKRM